MAVDLREKLRRALGSSGSSATADGVGPRRSRRTGPDVPDLVPGTLCHTVGGPCFVAERVYPLTHRHGAESLSGFLTLATRAMACLARGRVPETLDHREILFLDTETTGLSGGTGTFVFMVGLGFFDDDRFVVRQYFMRHHAEEPAMLAALNGVFPRFRVVVSFNGKAFDIPLLSTRFVTSRLTSALRTEAHIDLLFPSRRLWRDRLESCSLATIERAVLGHVRRGDVASWLIPELYLSYVRGGDARPIAQVFEHNLADILSLVALASRLGRLLGDPLVASEDARDLFAVARLYEDLGYLDDACACYERALIVSRSASVRFDVAVRLAALCKRLGQFDRAVDLWRRLVRAGAASFHPYVELAKYYEHRERDYRSAIDLVREALSLLELRGALGRDGSRSERAHLERRLTRLLDKERRAWGGGLSGVGAWSERESTLRTAPPSSG